MNAPDMHTVLLDRYQGQVDADEARRAYIDQRAEDLYSDFSKLFRGGDFADMREQLNALIEERPEQVVEALITAFAKDMQWDRQTPMNLGLYSLWNRCAERWTDKALREEGLQ